MNNMINILNKLKVSVYILLGIPVIKNFTFKNTHYLNNSDNLLSILFEKYGSDKGYSDFKTKKIFEWTPHTYSGLYFNLFHHCRESIKLVFECGIGSNNPSIPSNMTKDGKPGASLRAWRDFFPNAEVFGADIDRDCLFQEERIETFYVNQLDKDSIDKMWSEIYKKDFDLIIDDGLHTYTAGISFFENSFKKLRKGGIYVIEDVSYSYLNQLVEKLASYNPEVVLLRDKSFIKTDNNLILIRKF